MDITAEPPPVREATLTPKHIYDQNKDTLRDMIVVDHFSNSMPVEIIDLWLTVLDPANKMPLPPSVKGFYGGDLRASIPIELAHDCYKYVMHETDKAKIDKYANRMLLSISLLDLDKLARKDANLASLALWHKALAQSRLPGHAVALAETLQTYEALRPKATLSDSKLPQPSRLKTRLLDAAQTLGNDDAAAWLQSWEPQERSST